MLNAMINAALAAVNPAAWQTNENGEGSTAGQGDGIGDGQGDFADGMGDGMNGMGDGMTAEQMNTMIEASSAAVFGFLIVGLIIAIITLAGVWKVVSKSGQPGILGIIPFVNYFFIAIAAGKPAWWGVLMLVPLVQIVVGILILVALAQRFDRGVGTVLGLVFLPFIFWPMLGFGSAKWTPPPAAA